MDRREINEKKDNTQSFNYQTKVTMVLRAPLLCVYLVMMDTNNVVSCVASPC